LNAAPRLSARITTSESAEAPDAFSLNIDMPAATTDAPKRIPIAKTILSKLGVL